MEFKGTKDWKLSSNKNNKQFKKTINTNMDVISIDVDGHEGHIMLFGDNDEEHNANAKIAAAAPELLKALKSCVMSMQAHPDNEENSEFEGFVNNGWDAINKALN